MDKNLAYRELSDTELFVIAQIADKAWRAHYPGIISIEQIEFMLKDMYSFDALKKQLYSGHTFLLLESQNAALGFASFGEMDKELAIYKLHKLYLLPEAKGRGLGKSLISEVENRARRVGAERLRLNVNRANPAVEFYQAQGYSIVEQVDIPYHEFVLNDYVMEKTLE